MDLIVAGLGNPGAKYARNRHNIGFMAADAIASRWTFAPWRKRFQSEACEGALADAAGERRRVLLLKPQTFMNESGRAIAEAAKFYRLAPEQVVIFYDELDLAPGRFRMKTGGGAAGHNGVRSTIAQVGANVRRARMGIGHPGDKDRVHGYVLSDFAKAEEEWVAALVDACARGFDLLVSGEDEKYQTKVLQLAPAPKADPRQAARRDA